MAENSCRVIELADDVRWSVPFGGYVVLVSAFETRLGVLPSRALVLLPALANGTTVRGLVSIARHEMPPSDDHEGNVLRLVESLDRQGFLGNGRGTRLRSGDGRRWPSAGTRIGAVLRRTHLDNGFVGVAFATTTLVSLLYAAVAAPWRGDLALHVVAMRFHIEALAVVLVWVPLHEMGHAVAAVGQGIAVRGFVVGGRPGSGMTMRVGVDVTEVLLAPSKVKRAFVYFAGNLVDMLLFSVCALSTTLAAPGYFRELAASCTWLGVLIVLNNASPARGSDLSKGMANLVDDPLALRWKRGSGIGAAHRWHVAAFMLVAIGGALSQALLALG